MAPEVLVSQAAKGKTVERHLERREPPKIHCAGN